MAIAKPLTGNFATKNVVYGMIARSWAEGRAPLWRPTLAVICDGEPGWHLTEYPVSVLFTAGLWRVLGGSLDVWGRGVAAALSVGSVWLMFLLVRRWHGELAAWGAAVALALSPVSVIYGQSFMLESSVVFFTLAALCATSNYRRSGGGWLLIASICFSLLLLTKIYMIVMALPLAALCWQTRDEQRTSRTTAMLLCLTLAALPAGAWYAWAYQVATPGGELASHVFYSVRHSAQAHGFPSPLLAKLDFYRELLDDLSGPVLTPVGLTLAVIGLCSRDARRHAWWLATSVLLIVALPLKFHEMNYYWLVAVPPLCVLTGLGWRQVSAAIDSYRLLASLMLTTALAFGLRYSAGPLLHTSVEDRAVLPAAAALRDLAASGEPVATMHGSTLDLLYYCDRPGWALAATDPALRDKLDEFRQAGADWLVVANVKSVDKSPAAVATLANLPVEVSGDDFRIYRLDPPRTSE